MAAQDVQFFSAARIPQPRGPVPACRHHRLAIGEKIVRSVTDLSWPRKTCSSFPLAASHSRAVPSLLAVTTVLPSAENCALKDRALMAAQDV